MPAGYEDRPRSRVAWSDCSIGRMIGAVPLTIASASAADVPVQLGDVACPVWTFPGTTGLQMMIRSRCGLYSHPSHTGPLAEFRS